MDSEFLPSKKFVKVTSIVIAVFVLFVLAKQGVPAVSTFFNDMFSAEKQIDPEKVEAFQTYRELDTDGDGLYDWEEALFGTDKTKIDTDGNGKTDYEEFYEQRTAYTEDGSAILPGEIYGTSEEVTFTDVVARDIYTSLSIAKQQSDGVISDTDKEKLADIVAGSTESFSFPFYGEADFKISTEPNAKTKFITDFSNIQIDSPLNPNDIRSILFSIQNDTQIPADVLGRVELYDTYIQKHLSVTVPSSISQQYIRYVNSLAKLLTTAQLLAKSDTDPITALAAYNELQGNIDSFQSTLQDLQKAIQ